MQKVVTRRDRWANEEPDDYEDHKDMADAAWYYATGDQVASPPAELVRYAEKEIWQPHVKSTWEGVEAAIATLVEKSSKKVTTGWGFMDDDYAEYEEMSDYRMSDDIQALKKKVQKLADQYDWKIIEWVDDSDRSGMYVQVYLEVPFTTTEEEVSEILGQEAEEVEESIDAAINMLLEQPKVRKASVAKQINDLLKSVGFKIDGRETTAGAIKTWLKKEDGFTMEEILDVLKLVFPRTYIHEYEIVFGKGPKVKDIYVPGVATLEKQGKTGLFVAVYQRGRGGMEYEMGLDV